MKSNRHRLSVFISNKYIYAQVIKDGHTYAAASSMKMNKNVSVDTAKSVGKLIGEKALKNDITHVVFDRGRKKYHGRVAALADAARTAGLVF